MRSIEGCDRFLKLDLFRKKCDKILSDMHEKYIVQIMGLIK
jgi:hypothetical protein